MRARGFTLIEVVIALALLAAATLSVAQLIVATTRAVQTGRIRTAAVTLAASRLEELHSLTWALDAAGNSVTDSSTNLASEQPGTGGTGLAPSPPGALDENTSGFVDFLDGGGRWLSAGPAAPPGAIFVRRWAIEPAVDASPDTLAIQVVVRPIVEDAISGGRRPATARVEARLLTLRTRVAR